MRLSDVVADGGTEALLFTSPQGGRLRYGNVLSRRWHPTLERVGLPAVGLHVLRHSAAARMIAAGASPKTLQKVLGHRNAAFSPFTGISSTLAWTRWPIGSTLFLSIPIVQAATVIPVPPVGSLRLFVVQSIKFDFEGCLPFLFGIK